MSGVSAEVPDEPSGTPAVAVVVIGYNDAQRLPVAVQSVLNQTLRDLEVIIVDDASTDGTSDVARRLAAENPDRVRAVVLETNSGGCSRPRNVGLDHVTAPYVMFLDSDDTLERHACKNMLLAAERENADLVSGRCVRLNISRLVGPDKQPHRTPWMPWLYDKPVTYTSVHEEPDLLFDTLSTNKLYRRSFLDANGIRFPEGLLWEDLLFSTEAYCSAGRITLIPEDVYHWIVDEQAERVSISRQLANLDNWRDRLEIHRRIDAYLEQHGLTDLRPEKDRKFLRTDLKLYLGSLDERTPDYQHEWMRITADYLRGLDPRVWERCGQLPRAAGYLVLAGDLDGALGVAELWLRGYLATGVTTVDGRAYLLNRHLDDPAGREALDVTRYHFHSAPFTHANIYSRVTEIVAQGSVLVLHGETVNPDGRLRADDDLNLTVVFRNRRSPLRRPVKTELTSLDDDVLRWTCRIDVREELPPNRLQRPWWDLDMRLTCNGLTHVAPVRVKPSAVLDQQVRTRRRRAHRGGSLLVAERMPDGNLSFAVRHATRVGSAYATTYRRLRRNRVTRTIRRLPARTRNRRVQSLVYRNLLMRLPVRRDTVVFESHLGRIYGDSPKYVYEAMQQQAPGRFRAVWSYSGDAQAWPAEAVRVPRHSWRYFYELARAEYWVDNQGYPPIALRRNETRYLQTWHGTPLKTLGLDEPTVAASAEKQAELLQSVGRWTHFTVQGEDGERSLTGAYPSPARILRSGLPRNDILLTHRPEDIELLKKRLELPTDRKIALYAPTFRDYLRVLKQPMQFALNIEAMAEELGDEWFLMVRAHYLDRVSISGRVQGFARNFGSYHDVSELFLVADALITDYSSVMFDYALLRRPMLFYTYDYELYMLSRGTYFDLADVAPGPLVRTQAEVVDWLRDPTAGAEDYADRYDAFLKRFCGYETGYASEDAVRELLGPLSA